MKLNHLHIFILFTLHKIFIVVNTDSYKQLQQELSVKNVTLVAVSKTKPVSDILELYHLGHRDFGENYVQELKEKAEQLPKDTRWHFIGHLQSNKVKQVASFIHLIHGVDSLSLLNEINKQAAKCNRVIDCLLQVHIAQEETKFGMDEEESAKVLMNKLSHVKICGLMGMASFTNDIEKVRNEFRHLKNIFDKLTTHDSRLTTLSMGMSSDYKIAIEEGSNMVRIGSLIFGERN
jgi:pyridoxal phosphate enzyme (YggS family)